MHIYAKDHVALQVDVGRGDKKIAAAALFLDLTFSLVPLVPNLLVRSRTTRTHSIKMADTSCWLSLALSLVSCLLD